MSGIGGMDEGRRKAGGLSLRDGGSHEA